jgi:hypothetical protein
VPTSSKHSAGPAHAPPPKPHASWRPPYTHPAAASAACILCDFPVEAHRHLRTLLQAADAGNDWALQAALAADTPETLAHLSIQIQSHNPRVRRRAAECLCRMGPLPAEGLALARPEADRLAIQVMAFIHADDPMTARLCARALPWLGPSALPHLPEVERMIGEVPPHPLAADLLDVAVRLRAMGPLPAQPSSAHSNF